MKLTAHKRWIVWAFAFLLGSLGMAVAPFLSHPRQGLRAENQVAESVKAVKTSHAQIFRN